MISFLSLDSNIYWLGLEDWWSLIDSVLSILWPVTAIVILGTIQVNLCFNLQALSNHHSTTAVLLTKFCNSTFAARLIQNSTFLCLPCRHARKSWRIAKIMPPLWGILPLCMGERLRRVFKITSLQCVTSSDCHGLLDVERL